MKGVLPILLAVLAGATAALAGETRPIVVELFTSQSCASCPPADRLLGELARRPDVIALGFHVTYWNNTGWKDPLSRPEATERQKDYDRVLTGGRLYTPQMIIDGRIEAIGSEREAVLKAIAGVRPETAVTVAFSADRRTVTIGAAAGGKPAPGTAILLVRYRRAHTNPISAGENADKTAQDSNAVTALSALGEWRGAAAAFPIEPPAAGEGVAVLVQGPDGKMLGAAAVDGAATSPRPAPRA